MPIACYVVNKKINFSVILLSYNTGCHFVLMRVYIYILCVYIYIYIYIHIYIYMTKTFFRNICHDDFCQPDYHYSYVFIFKRLH